MLTIAVTKTRKATEVIEISVKRALQGTFWALFYNFKFPFKLGGPSLNMCAKESI